MNSQEKKDNFDGIRFHNYQPINIRLIVVKMMAKFTKLYFLKEKNGLKHLKDLEHINSA